LIRAQSEHARTTPVVDLLSGELHIRFEDNTPASTACLGLRDLIKSYPDFPYNEYIVVDTAHQEGPSIVWEDDFRTNTACSASIQNRSTPTAGQDADWQPTESGLEQAQIPSTDMDEIRVAGQTVNSIISEWQGNSCIINDPNWLDDDNMSVGFARDEAVMYIWADKPEWDKATRDRWAALAADTACQALLTEAQARKEWRCAQYAVTVVDNAGSSTFLRWGSAGSCARAPLPGPHRLPVGPAPARPSVWTVRPVRVVVAAIVTVGDRDELGAQQWPHPGHAEDHLRMAVLAEPALNQGIGLGDLLIEGHHLPGNLGHHGCGQILPGDGGVLVFGGRNRSSRNGVKVADLSILQPCGEAVLADPAQSGGGLVAGQQHQRRFGGAVVKGPFQRGEVFQELSAQSVDGASAVRRQIVATRGGDPQVHRDLVLYCQCVQVAAHPGLVGDDVSILGIGLPVTAVGTGGVVDGAAGDVEQLLPMVDQQRDQQGGPARVEVNRPGHDLVRSKTSAISSSSSASLFGTRRESTLIPSASLHSDELRSSQLAVESSRSSGRPICFSHQGQEHHDPPPKLLGFPILRMTGINPPTT
jgi:hypothetical protein